ncbi:MAG: hypothetical protein Q8P05_03275 [Candidatus Diapherotrites archaeon]|nr:hypothetical protein [Candidatus Diapherotrites archaeon]MDZ4255980.1 hypothetical protein [archaeon]
MVVSGSLIFTLLQGLVFLGSPGLAYVWVRSAIGGSEYWKGWKRMGASLIVGWGGVGWVFWQRSSTLTPSAILSLMEQGFWLILLLILSAGITGLVTRGWWHWNTYVPTPETQIPSPTHAVSKASRLRGTGKPESPLAPPILENDAMDVLELLKEESGEKISRSERKKKSSDLGFRLETSEFEGFDATMEQLRKDIKAFNQSLDKKPGIPGA